MVTVSAALNGYRHELDGKGHFIGAAFWSFDKHEFIRVSGCDFVPVNAQGFYGRVAHPDGLFLNMDFGGIFDSN